MISIDLGGNSGSPRWREGGEGAKEEATKGEKGEEGEKEGKVRNKSYQKFVIFRILLHFIALSVKDSPKLDNVQLCETQF